MSRRPGTDYAGQMARTLFALDAMKQARERTDLMKLKNAEQEEVRESIIQKREDEEDASTIRRSFEQGTGLALDADTQRYAVPIESAVKEQRKAKRLQRIDAATPRKELSFIDRLQGKTPDIGPRVVPPGKDPDYSEIAKEQVPKIREESKVHAFNVGFTDPNSPNYDPGIAKLIETRTIPVSKLDKEVSEYHKLRKLKAEGDIESTKADTARKTQADLIKQQELETENRRIQNETGILTNEHKRVQNAWQPHVLETEQRIKNLEAQYKAAQLAQMPLQQQKLEVEIAKERAQLDKINRENAVLDSVSRLATEYQNPNLTEAQRQDLTVRLLRLQGKHKEAEDYLTGVKKFNLEQSKEYFQSSVEAAKHYMEAKELEANKNATPQMIQNSLDKANAASRHGSLAVGSNKTRMHNVRQEYVSMISGTKNVINSFDVDTEYATARAKNQVREILELKIPENTTPQQKEALYQLKTKFLFYNLIEQDPSLDKNRQALLTKVQSSPEVHQRVKELMSTYINQGQQVVADQKVEKAQRELARSESGYNDPGEGLGQGELTPGGKSNFRPKREETIYGRPEDEERVKKLRTLPKESTEKPKNSETSEQPQSETLKRTTQAASEIFKQGTRYNAPKGTQFEEWLAEQGHRLNRNPSTFSAKELSTFYTLWEKHN